VWQKDGNANGFSQVLPVIEIPKADLVHAKVRAFIETLKEHTEPTKAVHISLSLGENFNNLLAEVANEYPEVANALPRHISSTGAFFSTGKAEATYLDLEIYARQIANMLGLIGPVATPTRPAPVMPTLTLTEASRRTRQEKR